jgi:hypothetical protein
VVVRVEVDRPGDVAMPDLGLHSAAAPEAATEWDLFTQAPGRHAVAFTPIGGETRRIGVLVVR